MTADGVQQVEPGKTFRIFIANFGKHPVYLRPTQVVAKAEDHPSNITEADISHSELLGIMAETTLYRKRDKNARYIDTIDKHLADARETHVGV